MKLIYSKCEGDILWLVRRELFVPDAPESIQISARRDISTGSGSNTLREKVPSLTIEVESLN